LERGANRVGDRAGGAPPAVRISFRLTGVLLLLGPLLGLAGGWLNFKWLGLIGGAAAIMWRIAREGGDRPETGLSPREPWTAGAALIAAGLLLSIVFSPVPGLGVWVALREWTLVGLAFFVARHRPTAAEIRFVLGCLIVAMVVQATLALLQFALPAGWRPLLPLHLQAAAGRARMIGTIGNPEYLATWIAAGGAAAWVWAAALWRSGGARQTGLTLARLAGGGLVIMTAIYLSGGRGALLSAGGAMLPALPLAWRGPVARREGGRSRGGLAIATAAGAGVMLAGLWALIPADERGGTLPARLAEAVDPHSPSIRHRIGLLVVTSRMIVENPVLGTGPGRFTAGFSDTLARSAAEEEGIGFWALSDALSGTYVGEAHSDALQWWAEYGLAPALGLSLMLAAALAGVAGRLRAGTEGERPDWERPVLLAAWACLAAFGISLATSFPLHGPVRAGGFWVMLGLVSGACCRGKMRRNTKQVRRNEVRRREE